MNIIKEINKRDLRNEIKEAVGIFTEETYHLLELIELFEIEELKDIRKMVDKYFSGATDKDFGYYLRLRYVTLFEAIHIKYEPIIYQKNKDLCLFDICDIV